MEVIYNRQEKDKYLKITFFMFFVSYVILYVLLGRILFNVDDTSAIVLMTAGLLPLVMALNEVSGRNINALVLFLSGAIMVLGKILYAIVLDPIATSDATRYYAQVINYESNFVQFLEFFWTSFTTDYLMMSAYPAFGIAYLPLYVLLNTESPLLIVLFNTFSLVLISYFSYLIIKKHFWQNINNRSVLSGLVASGLLISPTLMYWSSTFSKDVFSVLIAIMSLYFLLNKRHILFLLFLAYATMLRPYSIAIIVIFYALFKGSKRIMWLGVLGSVAVVAYYVGATGVINTFNTMAHLIASPNPFNLDNWDTFFLLEVEILFILGVLALSFLVFVNDKESRKFYFLALGVLFIYSCVMTLVGFEVVDGRELDYGLGSVGDNMSRKKVPIILLFYTVISYTFVKLPVLFRRKSNKKVDKT